MDSTQVFLKRNPNETVDQLQSSDESHVSAKKQSSFKGTPLSVFNQLYGVQKLTAITEGPPHMEKHTVSFQFSGMEFSSTATNKKKASQAVALEALKYMVSRVNNSFELDNMTLEEILKLLQSKGASKKVEMVPVVPKLSADLSPPASASASIDMGVIDRSRNTCSVTKDGNNSTGNDSNTAVFGGENEAVAGLNKTVEQELETAEAKEEKPVEGENSAKEVETETKTDITLQSSKGINAVKRARIEEKNERGGKRKLNPLSKKEFFQTTRLKEPEIAKDAVTLDRYEIFRGTRGRGRDTHSRGIRGLPRFDDQHEPRRRFEPPRSPTGYIDGMPSIRRGIFVPYPPMMTGAVSSRRGGVYPEKGFDDGYYGCGPETRFDAAPVREQVNDNGLCERAYSPRGDSVDRPREGGPMFQIKEQRFIYNPGDKRSGPIPRRSFGSPPVGASFTGREMEPIAPRKSSGQPTAQSLSWPTPRQVPLVSNLPQLSGQSWTHSDYQYSAAGTTYPAGGSPSAGAYLAGRGRPVVAPSKSWGQSATRSPSLLTPQPWSPVTDFSKQSGPACNQSDKQYSASSTAYPQYQQSSRNGQSYNMVSSWTQRQQGSEGGYCDSGIKSRREVAPIRGIHDDSSSERAYSPIGGSIGPPRGVGPLFQTGGQGPTSAGSYRRSVPAPVGSFDSPAVGGSLGGLERESVAPRRCWKQSESRSPSWPTPQLLPQTTRSLQQSVQLRNQPGYQYSSVSTEYSQYRQSSQNGQSCDSRSSWAQRQQSYDGSGGVQRRNWKQF